jgi:uncharacterized protein (DUF1697 family)
LRRLETEPEELRPAGRELHAHFPSGTARPEIAWPKIERIVGVSGTSRNWNSVTQMLEMAKEMEAGK